VEMMQQAYKLWYDLETEAGEQLFKQTGVLQIGQVDGSGIKNMIRSMDVQNVPYILCGNEELNSKYPQLKFDSKWRALFDPAGGLLKADRCLRAFQDQFVKHGGVLNFGEAVTKIETNGMTAQVHTTSGEYKVDGVAILAGTWSKSLLEQFLDLKLPLQPRVVKSCYWKVEKPGLYSIEDGFPSFICNKEVDGHTTDEFYGMPSDEYPNMVKICSHEGVNINHPDERDSVDASLYVQKPQNFITEHFKHIDAKPAIVETCLYTVTPDENFVLDKHPKYANIAIGAGFSGHGFKFASVVGEILGSLLLQRPTFDLKLFSINRFK